MLEQRRSKVIRAAAMLFLVMGASLVYFLFFNSGLQLGADPTDPANKVMVVNTSLHFIRDVSISYFVGDEKHEIQKIAVLKPHESVSIALLPEWVSGGSYILQAAAPYHLTTRIVLASQEAKTDSANVSFTFTFPTIAIAGTPSVVNVSACDHETFPLSLKAELAEFSAEGITVPPASEWSVSAQSCSDIELPFTAPAALDDLSFKIRVLTPSHVLAEKDAMIQVLPADANGSA